MLIRSLILIVIAAALFPTTGVASEATYTVTLQTLWNPSDHPNNFPARAHFSPLVGASHSNAASFWELGGLASPGIELVAELGSPQQLQSEVALAIDEGDALESVLIAQNVFTGQSAVSNEFSVTDDFPLLTVASMVAPSSDWFIGVHDLDLRDGAGGFLEEVVIDFDRFYDAGTEEGFTFSLNNPATSPQGVITVLSGAAAAAPFVGSGATELSTIARLTITRVSLIPEPTALGLALLCLLLCPKRLARRDTLRS